MNRNFFLLSFEYITLYAYNITNIVFLEKLVAIFAKTISCNIALNSAISILNIAETSLTHNSLAHNSTSNRYSLAFKFFKVFLNFYAMVCNITLYNLKWIHIHFL